MPCCLMLCYEECPATDVHSVLCCVILAASYVEGFLLRLRNYSLAVYCICCWPCSNPTAEFLSVIMWTVKKPYSYFKYWCDSDHSRQQESCTNLEGSYKDCYVLLCWACVKKCKSVPLQTWTGPEGSRNLRFADFVTTAQVGGKVVSLTHRPPLPPRKYSRYSFLLEAESTPGP